MSNEVVTQQNFQERMMERIRGSIGELMTDEELKKIVERGVEEVFFKQNEIKSDRWNSKIQPPIIHEIVKKLLTSKVHTLTIAYLKVHEGEINQLVEKIVQEGAGAAIMKALNTLFLNSFDILKNSIEQNIKNGY